MPTMAVAFLAHEARRRHAQQLLDQLDAAAAAEDPGVYRSLRVRLLEDAVDDSHEKAVLMSQAARS